MKKIAILLALPLLLFSAPTTIKILLEQELPGALIDVRGGFRISDPVTDNLLSYNFFSKRYYLQPEETGIRWGKSFPSIYQIKIVPHRAETPIVVNGVEYQGSLLIFNIEGKINIVNEIDIEDYLKTSLPSMISSDWELEVLDSIAVAMRTSTYHLVENNIGSPWHLNAKEIDYRGFLPTPPQYAKIERAIERTKDWILTYEEQPFITTWTENSAGHTASFSAIFRQCTASPPGTDSKFLKTSNHQNPWEFTISKPILARKLGLKKIDEIGLYIDKQSSKIYALYVKGIENSHTFNFSKLKELLAPDLLSNDFTIEERGDYLLFKGVGSGHGVGLCLTTSEDMALRGGTSYDILHHYFPNTELVNRSNPKSIYPLKRQFRY